MKFLADESCDYKFVNRLRDAGHDVASISEDEPGIKDKAVAKRAVDENRILICEDRDFGHYVFAHSTKQIGVIFLRYPFPLRTKITEQLIELIQSRGNQLQGKFVVIQPGTHRIRELP